MIAEINVKKNFQLHTKFPFHITQLTFEVVHNTVYIYIDRWSNSAGVEPTPDALKDNLGTYITNSSSDLQISQTKQNINKLQLLDMQLRSAKQLNV